MRLAKFIAGCGICSRRDAEKLIIAGRIAVAGQEILSPAYNVNLDSCVSFDGVVIHYQDAIKLWLYYKPLGLVTTHSDPQGRETVFAQLKHKLPRVISVGRLDLNSEGLLLLTNSGDLARYFESPKNNFKRVYKVRAFGNKQIETNKPKKIFIENIAYNIFSIKKLKSSGGLNNWYEVVITEGKNREIRKIFEHCGLQVNKLIRISFGEYHLGDLKAGEYKEVKINEDYIRKISGPSNPNG